MSILRAFLLTILLSVLIYLPLIGIFFFLEVSGLKNEPWIIYVLIIFPLLPSIAFLIMFHFFWKPKLDFKKVLDFKKLNENILFYILLMAVGYGFAFQPFWDILRIFDYYQNSNPAIYTEPNSGIASILISRYFALVVLAPVLEELFFRKFLFHKLLQTNSLNTSILVSSILFAFLHLDSPTNIIPTFFFGIISGLIYYKTKRIAYSILFHFFSNSLIVMSLLFGKSFFIWLYDLNFDFLYWALSIFGVLTIILGLNSITSVKINYDA